MAPWWVVLEASVLAIRFSFGHWFDLANFWLPLSEVVSQSPHRWSRWLQVIGCLGDRSRAHHGPGPCRCRARSSSASMSCLSPGHSTLASIRNVPHEQPDSLFINTNPYGNLIRKGTEGREASWNFSELPTGATLWDYPKTQWEDVSLSWNYLPLFVCSCCPVFMSGQRWTHVLLLPQTQHKSSGKVPNNFGLFLNFSEFSSSWVWPGQRHHKIRPAWNQKVCRHSQQNPTQGAFHLSLPDLEASGVVSRRVVTPTLCTWSMVGAVTRWLSVMPCACIAIPHHSPEQEAGLALSLGRQMGICLDSKDSVSMFNLLLKEPRW